MFAAKNEIGKLNTAPITDTVIQILILKGTVITAPYCSGCLNSLSLYEG